jgi:hypothetical protein
MITRIRSIINLLAENLGSDSDPFPIFRKEQSFKKPEYPYGGYKILSINGKSFINRGELPISNTSKVKFLLTKEELAIISLSFYALENTPNLQCPPIEEIYKLANRSINYLQVIGRSSFRELSVYVELLDTIITDRSTYLDTIYEYQVGFDFKIKAVSTLEQIKDSIDIDGTVNGIEYDFN